MRSIGGAYAIYRVRVARTRCVMPRAMPTAHTTPGREAMDTRRARTGLRALRDRGSSPRGVTG